MVSSYSKVIAKGLRTPLALATLVCAAVPGLAPVFATTLIDGRGIGLTGHFSRIHKSRDLWLNTTEVGQIAVNLDAFGQRREMVCAKLLDPADRSSRFVYGALNGDQMEISAEFFPEDRGEHYGYVKLNDDHRTLVFSASRFNPDLLVGRLSPFYPERFNPRVAHLVDPGFRRLLKLHRYLEDVDDSNTIPFTALGRFWNDGTQIDSDAIVLRLRHGPERGSYLIQVTGEVVPTRDRLMLVTRSGYRVQLRRAHYLPKRFREFGVEVLDTRSRYHKLTLTGVWREGSALRVFLSR